MGQRLDRNRTRFMSSTGRDFTLTDNARTLSEVPGKQRSSGALGSLRPMLIRASKRLLLGATATNRQVGFIERRSLRGIHLLRECEGT